MNRDDALTLPDGRELDVLIATKVLGLKVCDRDEAVRISNATLRGQQHPVPFDSWYTHDFYVVHPSQAANGFDPVPRYSSILADAWQVVEYVGCSMTWYMEISSEINDVRIEGVPLLMDGKTVRFSGNPLDLDLPLAIRRAALAAAL